MDWKGKYKSELLMVCHMDAEAMYKAGAISDKEMRKYDKDCLINPKAEKISTPVFTDDTSSKIKFANHATA